MAAVLTDPLIGHLIDGRYEVLSRIARGGMATVYLATDRRLDRDVAVKVMHPHLAEGGTGAEFVARFRREARAAARLAHPGLVAVFDQGVDGDTSYLTMEYVDGPNLRRHLAENGSLTVGEAFDVAEAVLDALSAAHRAGLVHRDVKPENVLLTADRRIKVADFGLARAVTEVTSTTTGTVLGTVAYLAPELVVDGTSDARTDVYAVGILLYEMITGRQPYTGTTPIQVAYQHVNSDVPAPSDAVRWLPIEVDELVGALAARDPENRPVDATGALALLRRARAELDAETLARGAGVTPSATLPEPSDGERADRAATTRIAGGDTADGVPADSDEVGTDLRSAVPADPDATEALHLGPRTTDHADDGGLGRTIALRIGTGVDSPDAPEPDGGRRPRRRRALALAVLIVAVLGALGAGAWWYMTSGPGAYTTVPSGVVGVELAQAEAGLAEAGLTAAPVEVFDPEIAAGLVVTSSPSEGERILKDGTVELAVSKGPDLRTVPADLVGQPVDAVVAALEDAGFVVPEPAHDHSDTVAAGLVLVVSAEAGASLPVDTEVTVTVSDGPAPVTIGSVVGAERDVAVADLEGQGLVVAVEEDYSEEYAEGLVIAQSPEAGTEGHRTDTVTITVSLGPPLVEVPNVMGNSPSQATKTLKAAGFEVAEEYGAFGRLFGARVVKQSPTGGDTAPKGSVVTITIT